MCLINKVKYKGRTIVVIIVVLSFFISIILNTFSNLNSDFTPRFTEPNESNKYYYSDLNLFYKHGYGMPNCTAYAYGRVYEILKSEPKLCPNDAGEWFEYNKKYGFYPYGKEPRLGAIACFNNDDGGHIAVVEDIKKDKITFSNSGYGYKNFYLTYAHTNDRNIVNNEWFFQGYIYILGE